LVSERSQRSRSFGRRIAWAIGGLFCFVNVIPEIDIERRLPQALLRKDFVAAESILDRAALYGRDSSNWRAQLANGLVKTQDPWRAIRQYKRSLDFYPQSAGFGQLGILVAKLEGLDEAIVIWGEGLEKFPQDIDLNRRMGMGLMKAARVPAALPFLEKWAELSPGDAAAIDAVEAARARITD
jgi:tetratricopeptide (TPR) repeat protein